MTAGIWRIGVNEVARSCRCQRLPKICGGKRPVTGSDNFRDAPDLIDDLRHVRRCKSLRFVAIRHIEFPVAVEAHHSIETRAIQKEEVRGGWPGVKAFANGIIVCLTTGPQ